jgi:hypothetical protein
VSFDASGNVRLRAEEPSIEELLAFLTDARKVLGEPME